MWVIALFCKENSVNVIPKSWLMSSNKACCWPPVVNVSKHIAKCIKPDGNWHTFGIRLLNEGKVYDNYLKARAAARLAEETSDINTTDNENQKRRRKIRRLSCDSSEESEESEQLHDKGHNNFPSLPDPPSNVTSELQIMEDATDDDISSNATPTRSRGYHSVSRSLCSTPLETNTKEKETTHEKILHTQKLQQQLSLINFKLNNLQSDISTVIEYLRKSDETVIPADFLYETLPLQEKKDLDDFENYLQNEGTFKKFVVFVQKIGGNSVYECVKRALSRIITNELATKYSWNGKKNKYAFCGLNLQKGLTAGIQTNTPTKNCSEKDIEGAVKSWLRHAKSRIKLPSSDGSSARG